MAVLRGHSDYGDGLPSIRAKGGDCAGGSEALVAYAPEIARCVATREGSSQDYESTTMVAVEVAPTMRAGGNSTGGDRPYGTDVDTCDSLAIVHAIQAGALRTNPNSGPDGIGVQADIAYTLEARAEVQAVSVTGPISHALKAEGADASEDGTGRATPIIAFSAKDYGADASNDLAPTLRAGGHTGSHANAGVMPAIATLTSAVRRLTPKECERLQGFPDDYTAIPWRGKPADQCPDGPRYKALGNSWAVPLFNWLGRRIADRMPR